MCYIIKLISITGIFFEENLKQFYNIFNKYKSILKYNKYILYYYKMIKIIIVL